MNTHCLPRPIPLAAPWPLRWLRRAADAVGGMLERLAARPRAVPHAVRIELSLRQLDDIGAPEAWRQEVESRQRRLEIERDSLRMQGVHLPLGTLRG